MMLFRLLLCVALSAASFSVAHAAERSEWNVLDYGAARDASSDCTAAFQKALDEAAKAGGGGVIAPEGRYRFDGVLSIPEHVALRGTYVYAPSTPGNSIAKEGPAPGTVFETYANAGKEDGAPFIRVGSNAALQGVSIRYPDQKPDAKEPTRYPYAVALRGNNPAFMDSQLLNPYQGIDASDNQRALIRNIHGQPIRLGLYVNRIYDIGRIENVHWNPWWSMNTPVYAWQMAHGEGFVFARTDWHYVLNTFCFGYHVGYRFTAVKEGATNGNFLGIGADDCETAILVEETAPMGVLITNGEFVSFNGPDPTMIRVDPTHSGAIRFSNCAFWGPANRIAVVEGWGVVGFSDCTFMQWGHNKGAVKSPKDGFPALDLRSGTVLVRGCDFEEDKKQMALGRDVDRGIITGNVFNGRARIENHSRGNVEIEANADSPRGRFWREKQSDMNGFRLNMRREREKAEQNTK